MLPAELDEGLAKNFPGPEPLSALIVGGACLVLQNITARATSDVDVIIFEMLGSEESILIFSSPVANKVRRIVSDIGKRHALKKKDQAFFNHHFITFLLEL